MPLLPLPIFWVPPHLLIYYILFAAVVAHLGRKTRIGFYGTFFCSLLLTPVVVLFIIILMSTIRMPRS